MRNGITVCRLSLIKTYILAYHVLRKFRDSAPLSFLVPSNDEGDDDVDISDDDDDDDNDSECYAAKCNNRRKM